MNLRQQQQQAFDRSGEPLIVGNVSHCPLPPETLAALGPDSPYVVQVYGSGLTGEVYRLRIAGKEYNLKKRRAVAGVANLNGQLSFLNEVQRRQALQQLKDDPVTAPRFTHIVPTLYAALPLDRRRADTPVDPAADRPAIYYSGSLRRTGADGVGSL